MKLEDYAKLIEGKICRWCGANLSGIEYYGPHDGGWKVDGFPYKLWLYAKCPKCGYEWALWKLGIGRDVDGQKS